MGDLLQKYGFNPVTQEEEEEVLPPPSVTQPKDLLSSRGFKPVEVVQEEVVEEPTQDYGSLLSKRGMKPLLGQQDVAQIEPEKPSFSRQDILADKAKVDSIRKMMVLEQGKDYETKPDDEVVDAFITNMRWFNSNEASTALKAFRVATSTEDELKIYGDAFKTYEEMGNMFTTGTWGDLAGGVWDYTAATVTSPSMYVLPVIGKTFGQAGSKAAQKAMMDTITKQVVKKTGSKVAADKIKKDIVNMVVPYNIKRAAIATGIGGASVSGVQDYMYQDTMMKAGAQDDYSALQTAASTLLGGIDLIGLGFGSARKGFTATSGLDTVGDEMKKLTAKTEAKVGKVVKEEIVPELTKRLADWEGKVKAGTTFNADAALRNEVVRFFLDHQDEKSFVSMLSRSGVKLDTEESGGFVRSIVDFANGLKPEVKSGLDEMTGKLGITFDQFTEILASTANEAGRQNQMASMASRLFNNIQKVSAANKAAGKEILAASALKEGKSGILSTDGLRYIQSVWKRMIVSSLPTTVTNVKGWAMAESAKTASEVVQIGLLGGDAFIKALMGKDSSVSIARAKALGSNLKYASQLVSDPFTTLKGFTELVDAQAPAKVKTRLNTQFFQGVDNRGAEAFNLDPTRKGIKFTENAIHIAQRLALVNAQDVLTKSLSGAKELDKQVRIKFKMGLDDLVKAGRADEITEEMWDRATDALQDTTFSRDFSRGTGVTNKFARWSQEISNMPGFGVIYPFGQFANSVVAFTYNYTPFGFISVANRFAYGAKHEGEITERLSRAMLGTAAVTYFAKREAEKAEQGLQWDEEVNDKGEVYKVTNLFPMSMYNAIGRALTATSVDNTLTLLRQLAVPEAFDMVDLDQVTKDLTNFISDIKTDEGDLTLVEHFRGFASGALTLASGFTRPLDTYNDIVGVVGETFGAIDTSDIDRKSVSGESNMGALTNTSIAAFSRYTDNFFKLLLGEDSEAGYKLRGTTQKRSATQEGEVKQGDPISSLWGQNKPQPRTNIDIVLGMASIPPYRADSFTTGVPEYDNWLNEKVFKQLELGASVLLKNEVFKKAPPDKKALMVNSMITEVRNDAVSELETPANTIGKEALLNLRKKLMKFSIADRNRAAAALGMENLDHKKMNQFQVEQMLDAIDLLNEKYKDAHK